MMKEAIKLIIFPHGKCEVTGGYKYVIGGILLSSKEIPCPNEAVGMSENHFGQFTELLEHLPKYRPPYRLGDLGSEVANLGNLTPDNCVRVNK